MLFSDDCNRKFNFQSSAPPLVSWVLLRYQFSLLEFLPLGGARTVSRAPLHVTLPTLAVDTYRLSYSVQGSLVDSV